MAGKIYTDAGKWAAAVRRVIQREKDKPFINAIRRGMRIARAHATRDLRSHGLVGKIFSGPKGVKGLRKQNLVGVSTKRVSETRFESALVAKGLARLQETGARTRPHAIQASAGKFLVFEATGRRGITLFEVGLGSRRAGLVATKKVKHPGGRVPRHPFLRQSVERARPAVEAAVKRAWEQTVAQVVG